MPDEAEPKDAEARAKVPTVTRKELVLRVQKATGARLRDVQDIIHATLEAMSHALKAGENLRLPPFGAARVLRQADPATGTTMRVALREVKDKERAPRPERPARPTPAPKAAKAAAARKAAKPNARRAAGAKQALAAKDEGE